MTRPRDPSDDGRDHRGRARRGAAPPPWPPCDPDAPDLLTRLGMVVPDDARELDDDVRALQLERMTGHPSAAALHLPTAWWARLRARARDSRPDQRWGALIVCTSIAATTLLLVGVITGLLTPRISVNSPSALPLATSAPGAADPPQLLPEGTVRRAGLELPARDLRPMALLVAEDPRCAECGEALRELSDAARTLALPVSLVVPPAQEGLAGEVVREEVGRGAEVVADLDGALLQAAGAEAQDAGPRLVLVHADGVVRQVSDPPPPDRLTELLAPVTSAGDTRPAPASASVP